MGAFFLVKREQNSRRDAQCAELDSQFSEQGFVNPTIVATPDLALYVYSKLCTPVTNCITFPNGDFCAATGTFFYRGTCGTNAMKQFLDDYPIDQLPTADIRGDFCLIIGKAGKTHVMIDDIGMYKVYRTENRQVWSSSFLVAARGCKDVSCDEQSCYEYIFTGGTYGGDTLLSEIKLLEGRTLYSLSDDSSESIKKWSIPKRAVRISLEESVDENLTEIRDYFDVIINCFGDRISTGLSGGYDSRHMIAMLLERGILPELHVYGADDDPDVQVAKQINDGERLGLRHFDRRRRDPIKVDEFPDIVSKTYHRYDGVPYAGIFMDETEFESRVHRAESGRIYLNGGGGEIYRNFFVIKNLPMTIKQFSLILFGKFDPSWCVPSFDGTQYLNRVRKKIQTIMGFHDRWLSRPQIDAAYVGVRSRFWMSRNNALDHRLGYTLTPFIDQKIVDASLRVPTKFKNFGRLQAAMIHEVNPRLAKYMSVYGHSFEGAVPLKPILQDLARYISPPLVRNYSFRFKSRRQRSETPIYLSKKYLDSGLPDGFDVTGRLFRPDSINDPLKFNRLATLEYLFQKVGASL